MKAILGAQYGPPGVLTLQEVEPPTPKDDEVLIRSHAASVNPTDWHRMTGTPPAVRKRHGEPAPANPALGTDVAGTVVAVGRAATAFAPGDDVFGGATGAFAEYTRAAERTLVPKPPTIAFAA